MAHVQTAHVPIKLIANMIFLSSDMIVPGCAWFFLNTSFCFFEQIRGHDSEQDLHRSQRKPYDRCRGLS